MSATVKCHLSQSNGFEGHSSSCETHLRATKRHTKRHAISTQIHASRLNPSQTGRYFIYLPWRDKWLVEVGARYIL